MGENFNYKNFQIHDLGVCACVSRVKMWKETTTMETTRRRPTRG
jgi:hypothetical protein